MNDCAHIIGGFLVVSCCVAALLVDAGGTPSFKPTRRPTVGGTWQVLPPRTLYAKVLGIVLPIVGGLVCSHIICKLAQRFHPKLQTEHSPELNYNEQGNAPAPVVPEKKSIWRAFVMLFKSKKSEAGEASSGPAVRSVLHSVPEVAFEKEGNRERVTEEMLEAGRDEFDEDAPLGGTERTRSKRSLFMRTTTVNSTMAVTSEAPLSHDDDEDEHHALLASAQSSTNSDDVDLIKHQELVDE